MPEEKAEKASPAKSEKDGDAKSPKAKPTAGASRFWGTAKSAAWRQRTTKEIAIDQCFRRNIVAPNPPPAIPPRASKAAAARAAAAAEKAEAEHVDAALAKCLERRGKRLSQLFSHADREREGKLARPRVEGMLRAANVPADVASSLLQRLGSDDDGNVTRDEFARTLQKNGYRPPRAASARPFRGGAAAAAAFQAAAAAREGAATTRPASAHPGVRMVRSEKFSGSYSIMHSERYEEPARPNEQTPPTSDVFHTAPYMTADRQVAAWEYYHTKKSIRSGVAIASAHPSFPSHGPMLQTNHTHSFGAAQSVGGSHTPRARPSTAPVSRLGTAPIRRAHADEAQLGTPTRPGRAYLDASHTTVMPGATVFTAQLARRALKTPAAFNSNARTSAERLYDRDPQPGMVWDRKRGWDVHARAPPVDERFLP